MNCRTVLFWHQSQQFTYRGNTTTSLSLNSSSLSHQIYCSVTISLWHFCGVPCPLGPMSISNLLFLGNCPSFCSSKPTYISSLKESSSPKWFVAVLTFVFTCHTPNFMSSTKVFLYLFSNGNSFCKCGIASSPGKMMTGSFPSKSPQPVMIPIDYSFYKSRKWLVLSPSKYVLYQWGLAQNSLSSSFWNFPILPSFIRNKYKQEEFFLNQSSRKMKPIQK